jgi:Putative DNA-binding domain
MSGAMPDLDRLQRWFQAVIMHPDGVVPGVLGPDARQHLELAPGELERVVTRSRSLNAADRVAIYGRAYHARLTECLEAEFRVLRKALGDDLFRMFTRAYLSNCPSHSYTLADLGKGFPGYLHDTRPAEGAEGKEETWPDFIIDLARYERAFSEVYDGPGAEGAAMLSAEGLRTLLTDQGLEVALTPAASLRLLTFRYPVHDYFDAARHGNEPELPAPAETFLAMNRRDYVVTTIELSAAQRALLSGLLEGETVGQSLQRAGASSPDQWQQLIACIEKWSEQVFFRGGDDRGATPTRVGAARSQDRE